MRFQVYMDGASGIPAGIYGCKLRQSVFVRQLNSAEKARRVNLPGTAAAPAGSSTGSARSKRSGWRWSKSIGIEVRRRTARTSSATRTTAPARPAVRAFGCKSGIDAESVAMSDIERGVGQRSASSGIHKGHAQLKGHAGFAFGNIVPELFIRDIIGTLFLLAGQRARGIVRSADGRDQSGGSGSDKPSPGQVGKLNHNAILLRFESPCGKGSSCGC